MTRIALLAALLSACTGTYYPYSSSQPQYASAQTTTTQTSEDGSVTTTTTETSTFEAYPTAQPAAYHEPAASAPPPPPAAPPPAPPSDLCHRKDTPDMCVAIQTMFEIGAIIKQHEDASCREASRALNRYADTHGRELHTFENLDKTHSEKQLRGFQKRHEADAAPIMGAALELDARCDGDQKLDRALRRVGFSGLIGSPVM